MIRPLRGRWIERMTPRPVAALRWPPATDAQPSGLTDTLTAEGHADAQPSGLKDTLRLSSPKG